MSRWATAAWAVVLVVLPAAAIAITLVAAAGRSQGQDSTYLYGTVERSDGSGPPRSLLLAVDRERHSLVFESEREQAEARNLIGKSVRVLGRPVHLGGQSLLLVVTIRPLVQPGEK